MNGASLSISEYFFGLGKYKEMAATFHGTVAASTPPYQKQSVLAANPNILYLQRRRKRPFLLAMVHAHSTRLLSGHWVGGGSARKRGGIRLVQYYGESVHHNTCTYILRTSDVSHYRDAHCKIRFFLFPLFLPGQ